MNKKIKYLIILFLLLIIVILGLIIFWKKTEEIKIFFFDVGQGDAILISQGETQVIIDGGKSGEVMLDKLGRHIPFWDRQIEAIVLTHPDQDHLEGLIDVIKMYEVKTVFESGVAGESETYNFWKNETEKEGAVVINAFLGTKIKFENGAVLEFLHPFYKEAENIKDTNDGSIIAKLVFGENKFLFTGDLPEKHEKELMYSGIDVKADVLKVAHHGSKYSTSEEFLEKVAPESAVISVGKNNKYGHPTEEVLERIKNVGANIFRTDKDGDIIFECKNQNEKCVILAN